MKQIKLNDILNLTNLSNIKIRLNISNTSWNASELYHHNKEELLRGHFGNSTGKKYFKKDDIVIGFAQINIDDWLLIDISKITEDKNLKYDGFSKTTSTTFYEYKRLEELEKYFGRLIITYHNKSQNMIRIGDKFLEELIVKEILPDKLENSDVFPGYDKVNISWNELKRVVTKESWKTALQNQKGVYLLTDTSNGKMYVGSASGKDMILGRWETYVKNGHGGNVGLKKLTFDYIKKNFKYSILDIYKSTTDDQIIINRETWWKEVLQSRQFGYNEN